MIPLDDRDHRDLRRAAPGASASVLAHLRRVWPELLLMVGIVAFGVLAALALAAVWHP